MDDAGATGRRGAVDPLILTAGFDPAAQATFQRLRNRHFPARLNIVPAHCTLFHALPGADRAAIEATIAELCAAEAPPAFATGAVRSLGRGVAVAITCPPLVALRGRLAARWADALVPQDRQGFRPHVTVQNKADAAAARALLDTLVTEGFRLAGRVEALALWHYRGGPWEEAARFAFGG